MRTIRFVLTFFLCGFTGGTVVAWLTVITNREFWHNWLGYLIVYGWPVMLLVTMLLIMLWPPTPPYKAQSNNTLPRPNNSSDKYPTEEK